MKVFWDQAPHMEMLHRNIQDQFHCPTQAIGGQCPGSLAEHYADVLFSVSRNCPSVLSLWLREALLPPGFPSSHLTAENKEHFCQQILRQGHGISISISTRTPDRHFAPYKHFFKFISSISSTIRTGNKRASDG